MPIADSSHWSASCSPGSFVAAPSSQRSRRHRHGRKRVSRKEDGRECRTIFSGASIRRLFHAMVPRDIATVMTYARWFSPWIEWYPSSRGRLVPHTAGAVRRHCRWRANPSPVATHPHHAHRVRHPTLSSTRLLRRLHERLPYYVRYRRN